MKIYEATYLGKYIIKKTTTIASTQIKKGKRKKNQRK
jgi:hypothetical protein